MKPDRPNSVIGTTKFKKKIGISGLLMHFVDHSYKDYNSVNQIVRLANIVCPLRIVGDRPKHN
jgi:hypothetical protein